MITEHYHELLISIGNNNHLPESNLLTKEGISRRVSLSGNWKSLSDDQLLLLFKGLVILEEYWFSNGDHIGSTTDTKFVYSEIRRRSLDSDYSIGNWAFQYSSNPYVPIDTGNRHGATTLYELFEWQRAFSERIQRESEDSAKRKEEKKRLKAEAHAERLRQKELRDIRLGYKKEN
jgi:hypothetical protein